LAGGTTQKTEKAGVSGVLEQFGSKNEKRDEENKLQEKDKGKEGGMREVKGGKNRMKD